MLKKLFAARKNANNAVAHDAQEIEALKAMRGSGDVLERYRELKRRGQEVPAALSVQVGDLHRDLGEVGLAQDCYGEATERYFTDESWTPGLQVLRRVERLVTPFPLRFQILRLQGLIGLDESESAVRTIDELARRLSPSDGVQIERVAELVDEALTSAPDLEIALADMLAALGRPERSLDRLRIAHARAARLGRERQAEELERRIQAESDGPAVHGTDSLSAMLTPRAPAPPIAPPIAPPVGSPVEAPQAPRVERSAAGNDNRADDADGEGGEGGEGGASALRLPVPESDPHRTDSAAFSLPALPRPLAEPPRPAPLPLPSLPPLPDVAREGASGSSPKAGTSADPTSVRASAKAEPSGGSLASANGAARAEVGAGGEAGEAADEKAAEGALTSECREEGDSERDGDDNTPAALVLPESLLTPPVRETRFVGTARLADDATDSEQVEHLLRQLEAGIAAAIPDDEAETHYEIGIGLLEMRQTRAAIASLQKAFRARAVRDRAVEALARAFLEGGAAVLAYRAVGMVLDDRNDEDDSQLIGLLYWRGRAAEAMGHLPEAMACYERVAVQSMEHGDVMDRIGRLAIGQGAPTNAGPD